MQMTLARETLTKCIGDVDEIKEKLLPKNGNRKQRMSDFLQFILQYDNNVIEFKRMLKRNGLQGLLREVDREIDAFHQDIEITVERNSTQSSSDGVLFESVIIMYYTESNRTGNTDESNLQDVVRCYYCENPNPSLHCKVCTLHLCKQCVGKHFSDETADHIVTPFRLRNAKCQKHSTNMCDFYCNQCNILICVQCASSSEHSGHNFTNMVSNS